MSYTIQRIENGGATSAKGFKAAGASAGIKTGGKLDIGILASQVRCPTAGVFTTNQLKGASLLITKEHLSDGYGQVVFVNSGCANACTGERGFLDAREIARHLARKLNIAATDVLPSSTGVIGVYLPLPNIREAIDRALPHLREDGGLEMAQAIMTTDTVPKSTARKVTVDGHQFILGGCAKGAGMIQPMMATMLSYITTDARISPQNLSIFLKNAVDRSFNRLTIDGDTSCCDTVLLMANGLSSSVEIAPDGGPAGEAFQEALNDLCRDLAMRLARDGEGVTKAVTIQVRGTRTRDDAIRIARAIANSPLVKTAIHGCDPNWGRILTAAGYSGVAFDVNRVDLWIGRIQMMHHGEPARFDEAEVHDLMKNTDYEIVVDLHQGEEGDFYITTDLSKEYIDINADYRHRT
ncbi:MAG: bifunctional glutamate N-acetyltransferase/amino-acid acetyltransferase ArgJ [Candidatus Omnitrophica bacterium]|nr:bifunctional glutamate N-acetyltransferase/amino-acid acetyltransferase ArgJ [Candidatus Omnitrophota bacterium]